MLGGFWCACVSLRRESVSPAGNQACRTRNPRRLEGNYQRTEGVALLPQDQGPHQLRTIRDHGGFLSKSLRSRHLGEKRIFLEFRRDNRFLRHTARFQTPENSSDLAIPTLT